MVHQRDPAHPILPESWKCEVVEFQWARAEDGERYVDLVLRHAYTGAERKLRFRRPVEVSFHDAGWSGGLFIDDISSRGMQGAAREGRELREQPDAGRTHGVERGRCDRRALA